MLTFENPAFYLEKVSMRPPAYTTLLFANVLLLQNIPMVTPTPMASWLDVTSCLVLVNISLLFQ